MSARCRALRSYKLYADPNSTAFVTVYLRCSKPHGHPGDWHSHPFLKWRGADTAGTIEPTS